MLKLAEILPAPDRRRLYQALLSDWKELTAVVAGSREPPTPFSDPQRWEHVQEWTHQMMSLDTVTYLPDDILVKVDRASMGVSLEARAPLLDHRVLELAWTLPLSMKVRQGKGKWLLRRLLYRYVPQALIERPPKGIQRPHRRMGDHGDGAPGMSAPE